jgi:hypothetical protein
MLGTDILPVPYRLREVWVPKEKIFAQARDELFSHINRCGVLNATDDDMTVWMNETIDYIGERYPDLADADLQELHAVGVRFCQPAINNVPVQREVVDEPDTTSDEAEVSASIVVEEPVPEGSSASSPAAAAVDTASEVGT